jgi:hypothetical protein
MLVFIKRVVSKRFEWCWKREKVWILFGFYPCKVLELVVISMTSSNSSKTDFG